MFPLTLVIIFVPNSWNNQGTIKVYNCLCAWICFSSLYIYRARCYRRNPRKRNIRPNFNRSRLVRLLPQMSVLRYTQSSSWLLPRDVTSSSFFPQYHNCVARYIIFHFFFCIHCSWSPSLSSNIEITCLFGMSTSLAQSDLLYFLEIQSIYMPHHRVNRVCYYI